MSPDNLRVLLPTFLIVAAVIGAGADFMLWFTRRSNVPWTDVARIPTRWTKAELYTETGNRFRRVAIYAMIVLLIGFLFWQVVLGPAS